MAVASRNDFMGGIPCTRNERIGTPYHQRVVALVTGTTQPAGFPWPSAFLVVFLLLIKLRAKFESANQQE
jgi:hypothetical protein